MQHQLTMQPTFSLPTRAIALPTGIVRAVAIAGVAAFSIAAWGSAIAAVSRLVS